MRTSLLLLGALAVPMPFGASKILGGQDVSKPSAGVDLDQDDNAEFDGTADTNVTIDANDDGTVNLTFSATEFSLDIDGNGTFDHKFTNGTLEIGRASATGEINIYSGGATPQSDIGYGSGIAAGFFVIRSNDNMMFRSSVLTGDPDPIFEFNSNQNYTTSGDVLTGFRDATDVDIFNIKHDGTGWTMNFDPNEDGTAEMLVNRAGSINVANSAGGLVVGVTSSNLGIEVFENGKALHLYGYESSGGGKSIYIANKNAQSAAGDGAVLFTNADYTNYNLAVLHDGTNGFELNFDGNDDGTLEAKINPKGDLQIGRIQSTTPAENLACGSTTVGTMIYVDDTDDSAAAQMCVCIATGDDGAGAPNAWDWRKMDDLATACTSI